jgi:hypothetical protein
LIIILISLFLFFVGFVIHCMVNILLDFLMLILFILFFHSFVVYIDFRLCIIDFLGLICNVFIILLNINFFIFVFLCILFLNVFLDHFLDFLRTFLRTLIINFCWAFHWRFLLGINHHFFVCVLYILKIKGPYRLILVQINIWFF